MIYIDFRVNIPTPKGKNSINLEDRKMGLICSNQILEQFPEGTQFVKVYMAVEGYLRAVVILPGEEQERRYSIELIDEYPKIIKEMP